MAWPIMAGAQPTALATALATARTDGREAGPVQEYAIEAGPLSQALTAFGTISQIDILYENGVVDAKRSSRVAGRYTPRQAIAALLEGTSLEYRFTSLNAVLIFPPQRPPAPGKDAWASADTAPRLTLDVLRVTAAPIIGGSSNARFETFARALLAQISQRLQTDPGTHQRAFGTRLAVRLGPNGAIESLEIARSTGDVALDRRIQLALTGLAVGAPPPGMPEPIWFDVSAR